MTINKLPLKITRAQIMLNRLERLSADSPWAHQASGVRASIAKKMIEPKPDQSTLEQLLKKGFEILEKAASEIPED